MSHKTIAPVPLNDFVAAFFSPVLSISGGMFFTVVALSTIYAFVGVSIKLCFL